MNHFRKWGGIASLYEAAAYIIGITYYIFILDYLDAAGPVEKMEQILNNHTGLYIITLITYVIFGIFMVVLSLALHERLRRYKPSTMQITTVFGLFWALVVIASGMIHNVGMEQSIELYSLNPERATTVWASLNVVHNAIGGGTEIIGGIWILLISWIALRAGEFPKVFNILGFIIGISGILSDIPGLGALGGVFALFQIVWFIWLGVIFLSSNPPAVEGDRQGVSLE